MNEEPNYVVGFFQKKSYGMERFYPCSKITVAICSIAERKCLTITEVALLRAHGFEVKIKNDKEKENDNV